jgi:hypothetical protein
MTKDNNRLMVSIYCQSVKEKYISEKSTNAIAIPFSNTPFQIMTVSESIEFIALDEVK